ncbi:hypothetical protein PVA17_02345 [Lysinibacillus sp. CNPSo 3705]|uniref:hypothetical protein n=1 Tax=Lysinibacillus sp. CNPSo 3705 TaxID=3028148 RepID=UPI0023641BD7|nr:hypothetical protein [Lysinibacillus sp. CNPSo 3705]MDD1501614.1 hypothetical protein [Lysinibacillus sp. CNPSo 3705]
MEHTTTVEHRLTDHEKRLQFLEKQDVKKSKQLENIEQSYMKLENTILKENQETRNLFKELTDRQWSLIEGREKAEEAKEIRDYELNASEKKDELEFRKQKFSSYLDLAIKLLTAGGLIYLLIESLLKN